MEHKHRFWEGAVWLGLRVALGANLFCVTDVALPPVPLGSEQQSHQSSLQHQEHDEEQPPPRFVVEPVTIPASGVVYGSSLWT